ncbi:MAG: BTAD domain-containing putative transcriptional regulator, partial [Gemmatimonadota bacterium]
MIEFRTLGQIDLTNGSSNAEDGAVDPSGLLTQSKPTAVFSYLLLSRPPGFRRRDEIVTMFWPESDQKRSRAALSQVLYILRRALGPDVIESRGVEEIGIVPGSVRCDAIEFRQAIDLGHLEVAMALYGGELLPAFFTSEAIGFERWLDGERSELGKLASSSAWSLAENYEKLKNVAAAGHWGRRAAALSPYDEASAQRVMEMLARLGDRSGALKAYDRFRETVISELEFEPSEATTDLAERIRESMAGPARESGAIESLEPFIATTAPALPSDHSDVTVASRRRPITGAVATILAVAAIAAFFLVSRQLVESGPRTAVGDVRPAAIAVLPINAMGAADTLRAGLMTSKLIESLVRAGFKMPPHSTVNGFRDSVPAFYRGESGVDWFVEGDLIEEDGISELSIRIVDPRTDLVVWAQPFREGGRPMSDFMLDVAQLTADSLAVRMGLEASRIRVPRLTADPIADSLYSRARYLVETNNSLPGVRQAAALFAGAIERDSVFAPAYVGLAIALSEMGRQYWDPPPLEQAPEVGRLLQRAIELDPTHAETHAALGWYAYTYEWDWEAAEQHYLQALELDPDLAVTYTMYAFLVLATGRIEEGLELSRHATELAPLNPRLVTTYCWHLYLANRFEDVADACQRVITQL